MFSQRGLTPLFSVVLMGIGHTHLEILRRWGRDPVPGCRLICISPFPTTTYSGMLSGVLSGQLDVDAMQIEIAPLANAAGAELCVDEVVAIERDSQILQLREHGSLRYDVLSIGVGSIPSGLPLDASANLVPIKPMQTFLARLEDRIEAAARSSASGSLKLVVVGAGVAGVELALCLHAGLSQVHHRLSITVTLIGASSIIAAELPSRARSLLDAELDRCGIERVTGEMVVSVERGSVVTDQGSQRPADCVVWATGAAPPPILSSLGLPLDQKGFLATRATLQSIAGDAIFAVGDCATISGANCPKAGVYAVRQAPVLWRNLGALLAGQSLTEYRAQSGFLKLVNTGRGSALLEYRGVACHARWCWWLKRWIDRRFVGRYRNDELETC